MNDVQVSGSTGAISADSKGRFRRRIGLIGVLALVAGFVLPAAAHAAAPVIVNSTNFLEGGGISDRGGTSAESTITLLVSHAPGRSITGIKIDQDYNGTFNDPAATNTPSQRPTIVNGYDYSRITYTYTASTGNSGLDCPTFSSGTNINSRQVQIRAVQDNSEVSATASQNYNITRYDCFGKDDLPVLTARGQNATSINTGGTVNFTYTGDDSDSTGTTNQTFGGLNYRLRKINSDGTISTSGTTLLCSGFGGDNTARNFNVTFPNRGHYIVEAELRNENNTCTTNPASGTYWRLGSVDVNAPASSSPNIALQDVPARPNTGASFTTTANVNDNADSANGGVAQDIEWDLNNNTGDGVNGFEDVSLGNAATGLTTPQTQRLINTTSFAPGTVVTLRARVGDNGALSGADDIRRTNVATAQFTVNSPPTTTGQTVNTTTDLAQAITLTGSDPQNDTLTYNIVSGPSNGNLAGSGASRTYTSNNGFAGTDSFTYNVTDGFGGSSATVTVTINVRPETTIDAGPAGGSTVRPDQVSFDFSSNATGATFECQIDGGGFSSCASPQAYPGLADGSHTFQVRAVAGGQTDQSPASRTFTVDGTAPQTTIDSGPSGATNDTTATFTFSSNEGGSTFECSLDGAAFTSCTSPATYSGLSNGAHTFDVQATDAAGNTDPTPASSSFTVTDAAIASVSGATATYQAAAGDTNNVTVAGSSLLGYVFTDTGPGATIEAGAGCTAVGPTVTCPGGGVTDITVNLSDGDDTGDASGVNGANVTMNGANGADTLTGSPGDDTLNGGTGDASTDRMTGGPGNDTLDGGPGIDRALYTLSTGPLNITIGDGANDEDGTGSTAENVMDTVESITGSPMDDALTGSCFANTLAGQGGNDTINGDPVGCAVGGGDFMGGGAGNDAMTGLDGTDAVTYTTNTAVQAINVTLDGAGNDTDGLGGTDNIANDVETVYGGAGNDTIDATDAIQGVALYGRAGDDILTGSPDNDFLRGEAGADTLDCAGGGNDMFDDDPADTSVINCETAG